MARSRDREATGDRLTLALAASLALHLALMISFATRAGLPGGVQPVIDSLPAQALSVSLRQFVAPIEAPRSPALSRPATEPAAPRKAGGAGGGDRGPQPLFPIAPAYPDGALALGVSAKVEVRAVVDESGHVEQANVVSTTLSDVFDRSALAAVRETRFVPATEGGRPVKSAYRAVIFYDLK